MDSPSLSTNSVREGRPSANIPRQKSFDALTNLETLSGDKTTVIEVPQNAVDDAPDGDIEFVDPSTRVEKSAVHHEVAVSSLSFYSDGLQTPETDNPSFGAHYSQAPDIVFPLPVVRRYRRAACGFLAFFSCGWADGTPGTILPYLEKDFGLTYLTVSLLFVAGASGFAIGTVLNEPMVIYLGHFNLSSTRRRYIPHISLRASSKNLVASDVRDRDSGHSLTQGRFWTLLVAASLQLAYFCIAALKPHFYSMLVAFCLGGIAFSLLTGQLNAYVSTLPNHGRALGHIHGFYGRCSLESALLCSLCSACFSGIGACAAPLVCQTVLARSFRWSVFYWISFGIAFCNCFFIIWAFHTSPTEFSQDRERGIDAWRDIDAAAANDGDIPLEHVSEAINGNVPPACRPRMRRPRSNSLPQSTMKQTLREPYVWIFAVFLCLYTGSETTVGGWSVSFLLVERHANRAVVGYVASGFWGGLAAGRLFFGQLSPTIGLRIEKHLVHIFIFVAVVLELLVLFVPSFLANSVCIGFVGFVLGPLFPISLSIATKLLPTSIHLTALATMSSFASIGSALFPFLAGVVANSTSVKAIEPMVLILLSGMAVLWFLFPSRFQS